MRQLVTDAPKTGPELLTALANHAEPKDAKPIYTANSGPIIGNAFYYGKSGVSVVFERLKKATKGAKACRVASKKKPRLHI
ncbi:hypothetical protein [Pseudomonas sp. NA-150]|uniref:hypothetical protein n=1 Tax=Pseudomonas sp. NA-150 TaxID=3367525 RepID=UPI0037CC420B